MAKEWLVPDRPARIERWPAAPRPANTRFVWASLAALCGFIGAMFLTVSPLSEHRLAMRASGGGLLLIAPCLLLIAVRTSRLERARLVAQRRDHEAQCQRLVPRWARVQASEFGARREGYAESGPPPLLGFEMLLTLEWLPDPRTGARAGVLQLRHDFEAHVADALLEGALLEVAYDPVEQCIVPQRVLNPDSQVAISREPLD